MTISLPHKAKNDPGAFWKGSRWVLIIPALLPLLGGCSQKKDNFDKTKKNAPTIVDVIVASKQSISERVEINGAVVANHFAELKPEVSGLLTYVNVPEGKVVQKGTVIARLNNADLMAQMKKIEVQIELAKRTEARIKKLIAVSGVNQAEYDLALNNLNALQADKEYTQALLDKTIIRAPFTGSIGLRKVSEGAVVTPATIIATIQQLNQLRVDFTIPELYQAYISKGKQVRIRLNGEEERTHLAQIIATEPGIDPSTRTITVRAALLSGQVNPGAFVKVYLDARTDNSAIMVPTNCIIPEAKSKKIVTVKNGKAHYVVVETGDRQADYIEVISGLYPGDSVVVSGVLFTRPDAPVKVRSVKDLNATSTTE
ncbi:efflux RND transporter periplasmic adaptor subunit [Dyadobacter tibetensis]|uniref:efflux RND transporter periplasmic adaptor subunit n=1 Tax=Dyadobacter tibetensis TaxID=1211851 RepID=UPI00046F93FD|nr:efflux RND transporter periplasmic adaptor subunit [Dyadobacter tibetensis]